jgi:hypothetical protein
MLAALLASVPLVPDSWCLLPGVCALVAVWAVAWLDSTSGGQ